MEIWKDIKGYEGFYKVSNLGRVKSLPRWSYYQKGNKCVIYWNKGRILKSSIWAPVPGYYVYRVNLRKEGKADIRRVHHLIMESFKGDRPEGYIICHNDGNSLNNHIDNLRYDTHYGNYEDAIIKHNVLSRNNLGRFEKSY